MCITRMMKIVRATAGRPYARLYGFITHIIKLIVSGIYSEGGGGGNRTLVRDGSPKASTGLANNLSLVESLTYWQVSSNDPIVSLT